MYRAYIDNSIGLSIEMEYRMEIIESKLKRDCERLIRYILLT